MKKVSCQNLIVQEAAVSQLYVAFCCSANCVCCTYKKGKETLERHNICPASPHPFFFFVLLRSILIQLRKQQQQSMEGTKNLPVDDCVLLHLGCRVSLQLPLSMSNVLLERLHQSIQNMIGHCKIDDLPRSNDFLLCQLSSLSIFLLKLQSLRINQKEI